MSCSESPWKPWLPRVFSILSWGTSRNPKFQRYKGWDPLIVYRPSCHKNCNKIPEIREVDTCKFPQRCSLQAYIFFCSSFTVLRPTSPTSTSTSDLREISYCTNRFWEGSLRLNNLWRWGHVGSRWNFTQSERYCKMSVWLVRDDEWLFFFERFYGNFVLLETWYWVSWQEAVMVLAMES